MTRWVVHGRFDFTATHALTSYLGEPEEPHSHRWSIAVRAGCDELNSEGYAIDFHAVQTALEEILAPLDGSDLNLHPEIAHPTPSAERVAEFAAERLAMPFAELGGKLLRVTVWEGPGNRVDLNLGTD